MADISRALVVSPHLDDAALSAGAAIASLADRDADVTVLTVFAGRAEPPFSAAAARLHGVWRLAGDPVTARREEDRRAIRRLGARAVHGDVPDVIYRRYPDGAWVVGDDGAFTRPEEEKGLLPRVRRLISDAIGATRPDLVLTCAAVGDHVDHCLTRDAVLAAARGVPGVRLRLWEDIPYAVWYRGSPEALAAGPEASELVETPGDREWRAKYDAVAAYASQLRMMWPDSDFRDDLDRHARSLVSDRGGTGRGELFWTSAIRVSRAVVPGACCHFDPEVR